MRSAPLPPHVVAHRTRFTVPPAAARVPEPAPTAAGSSVPLEPPRITSEQSLEDIVEASLKDTILNFPDSMTYPQRTALLAAAIKFLAVKSKLPVEFGTELGTDGEAA